MDVRPLRIHRATERRRRPVLLLSTVAALTLAVLAAPASAAPPPAAGEFTATGLNVADRASGFKAASSKLAKTDRSLLGIKSSAPVRVVVKLDYDATANYRGSIKGLPATSPAVTRRSFNASSDAVRRYEGFAQGVEQRFLDGLRARVPAATPGRRLRTVFGGMALTVPGNQVAELLKLPGAVAVQADSPERLLTDSSPAFIGAPTIYSQLGQTAADAGKGAIVGVLDTGAWPEHPSYVDHGNLPAPPPKADGTPRTCDFGDNPLTPASDVFVCQRKLISGQPFLDTYNAVFPGEVYPDSARDSNGHGTHTSTTAAGGPVSGANPLGINRGDIHGIAPGAHVAIYKVCGFQGCFPSDSAAAVAQAIRDGVDVINFSISGGEDPFADTVELAFLDAYAAGVLVSASAGNSGPGADTVAHNGPWTLTVAASTQSRTFRSTVTLRGAGGATATVSGATITSGVESPLPIVRASDPPYSNAGCTAPAPAGLFTGKIVACERGPGRVARGFNVLQGGAAGMILYNATPLDVMTDNHWLPTVHIDQPDTTTLLDFLAANPGATGSFPAGSKTTWQGDRVTWFSSRGPGGDWLKPDVTAPGLHILAGNTPTPDSVAGGPPGNLFQAIAGTSMSSPHAAGSAALVAALHPDWTPGQIKSALETTAKTAGVTKSDGVTPADPFDVGGGRVDLTKAGDPGLTFNETAANYAAAAADPLNRIDLNTPSVNAPTMPGVVSTVRRAKNVSGRTLLYTVSTSSSPGTSISVNPAAFILGPNQEVSLNIRISAPAAPNGQYFGRVNLDQVGGPRDLHLPVAFFKRQGALTVSQTCEPSSIQVLAGRSTCTVSMQNNSLTASQVTATSDTSLNLRVDQVTGATKVSNHRVRFQGTVVGRTPASPVIAPGASPAGYVPLDALGVTPLPIGDEDILNFNSPAFAYAGQTWNRFGVTSDGYLVAGGGTEQDVLAVPQRFPNPARPNGVLAPFWTDLDGTGAPGVFVGVLRDSVTGNRWIVVEWRLNVFGTDSLRVFQTWIGINGTEDVSFAYDPARLPAAPLDYPFNVGAENGDGTAGSQIAGLPTTDLRVTSTPGAPGGTATYSFTVQGLLRGTGTVRTDVEAPGVVRGTTTDVDTIEVTR